MAAGTLIDGIYRVEEGPLGKPSGEMEAEVYRCRDEVRDGTIVAVKLYRVKVEPNCAVLKQLKNLGHRDIVELQEWGKWNDRFYEVMELCEGGTLEDFVPFGEEQLRAYLPEVVAGLHSCHIQGVIHGNIRPNNIFFRKPGKLDLVIGSLGASSWLEGEEITSESELAERIAERTTEYAAPELLEKLKFSRKNDYYSLGISLIHLLMGRNPFQGKSRRAIHSAHTSGDVPFPDGISDRLRQLLSGLTQRRPENRWGYSQVHQWLNDEPAILTDFGTVWKEDEFVGDGSPYPGYPQATSPAELAHALDRFDSKNELFKGDIAHWVFHHVDPKLAKRIEVIQNSYKERPELGLLKLKFLLNPDLPLRIADNDVESIEDLIDLLRRSDEPVQAALEKALWEEHIESWLEASRAVSQGQELASRIRLLRQFMGYPRPLATFSLLYLLDPTQPLVLAEGAQITKPEELEELLAHRPDLLPKVEEFLYGGQFEEWLRHAFGTREADLEFVQDCKIRYRDDPKLGVYAFRWHFKPSVPFPFGTRQVSTPVELAAAIDASPEATQLGIELLAKGWIRTWLATSRKLSDPSVFDELLANPERSWPAKMEAVLHILNPALLHPKVSSNKKGLKLGRVSMGATLATTIELRNVGRGYLTGSMTLLTTADELRNTDMGRYMAHYASHVGIGPGITIDKLSIEGGQTRVTATVKPIGLPYGSLQVGVLLVTTNGGALEIPILYKVSAPLTLMVTRSLLVGAAVGLALWMIRIGVEETLPSTFPKSSSGILDWVSITHLEQYALNVKEGDLLPTGGAEWLAVIFWGALLCALIGGAVYYVARMASFRQSALSSHRTGYVALPPAMETERDKQ